MKTCIRSAVLSPAVFASILALLAVVFVAPPDRGVAQQPQADSKGPSAAPSSDAKSLAGSASCRECHARFYQLWSTSHHGLAMQPYTAEFARRELTSATQEIAIGAYRFRAEIAGDTGWVHENGPQGEKKYQIEHVLGGKTVYYFLTPLDRGRLQTLPVAYDVHEKQWIDTAGSGVRHFPGRQADEPFFWTEWPYTFNSACYGCHVSQAATNYDLKTDTYRTVWAEPGINCETCHGPALEHVRIAREKPPEEVAKDLRLISTKKFTVR